MDGAASAVDTSWIKDVFVFLGAAGIVVPFFHRMRFGAVFGFLVVGLVVGPFGLGRIAQDHPWVEYLTIGDPERVEPFAELGVIFLLFLLGLELSFARLWQLRRYVLGVGAAQVGLSALAIGAAAAFAGADRQVAIVLGLCLALSSTAIVMQLLREQNRTATPMGRLAFSVLLFQDLMVVPILFVIGVLGRGVEGGIGIPLAIAVGQAALAVAAIMFAGRYLVQPLLRFVIATGSRDLIMAVTVLIVVAAAGATGAAGLSTALGAFLAGLLLGETEYRHQIEIDLDPFKGILLGLFFVTVGMTIDLREIAGQALYVVLAVAGIVLVKSVILYGTARLFGVAASYAIETAVLLSQAGEFALVAIALARSDQLLQPQLAQFATAVVGLSMILTPLLAVVAGRLATRAQPADAGRHAVPADDDEFDDHVVIAGFGRVGQAISRVLQAESVSFVALDSNGSLVARERKRGQAVYFGDARQPEILERAGVARARAIVVTLDHAQDAERMVTVCNGHWPNVPIFARAKDQAYASRLTALGAFVVPEVVEPSLQLAGCVLEEIGLPNEKVAQRLAYAREAELGRTPLADESRPAKHPRRRSSRQ